MISKSMVDLNLIPIFAISVFFVLFQKKNRYKIIWVLLYWSVSFLKHSVYVSAESLPVNYNFLIKVSSVPD